MQNMPWHNELWASLGSQIAQETLPHALLFSGVEGVGKLGFAKHIAALVLCEGDKSTGFACGQCKQCRLIESDTHSDFRVISPEDGSSVIKVDTMRSLVEFISQSSFQGGYKVVVLCPAEALNINAANALLKTLEEPSKRSLIILITHSPGQLLPTIRSRCQGYDFALPNPDQAKEWMATQPGEHSSQDLELALVLASGAPLVALSYLEMGAVKEVKVMIAELGRVIKKEVTTSSVAERWSDDLAKNRLIWTIQWLEMVIRAQSVNDVSSIPEDLGKKMFGYLAQKVAAQVFFNIYDASLTQLRLLQGTSNPNKALLFEHLLRHWSQVL